MTREKAIELVSYSGCMVLRVCDDEAGILILAYNYHYEAAIEYYFSKKTDYIEQQVLSPVALNKPSKMRVVHNHLEYDC